MTGDVPVKVLYISAWGRSGTTILDNLLGELDGFFSAGELRYLWRRGLLGSTPCGCGLPIASCTVWPAVLNEAFSGVVPPDPVDVVRWQEETARFRHTWRLLRQPSAGSRKTAALQGYSDALSRIYQAIARVTGARVIVDSSKRPSEAALLRLLPGVVPYYVHMVRDPRAVAYSWQRRKQWTASTTASPTRFMRRHGPVDSTLGWISFNLAAEAVANRHASGNSMRLRYEDFMSSPQDVLRALAELVDEHPAQLPFVAERTVQLGGNHTVSGNPSRFKVGTVELRDDDEWRAKQSKFDRIIVTSLALPFFRRYGYAVRPATRSSPA
jgi:Sulfotransferase family